MSEDDAGAGAGSPPNDLVASALSTREFSRGRVALWAVAVALIAVLGYIAWRYVGTFVLGVFVYYVTRPVFQRIHARLEQRTLAVVVSLVTVALPVLVLVGWTLSIAFQALSDFFDSDSPDQFEDFLRPYVDISALLGDADVLLGELIEDPSRLGDLDLGPFFAGVTDTVVSSLGVLFDVAIHGFVVLILAFYLLRDGHRVAAWARRTFVGEGGVLESYFLAVDRDLKNVYFGNILNALVTGILAATTYILLNAVAPDPVRIPEAPFLGLLVGAASLVPVIGIKIVWVPLTLFLVGRAALAEDPSLLWFPAVFVAVSVVVVDYIPDQLLRPYVSGRTLHVGAVMLAYTLGPLLFGWYGIFLAPFILVVVFEFARIIFPWLVDPGGFAARVAAVDDTGPPAAFRSETDAEVASEAKPESGAAEASAEAAIDDAAAEASTDAPAETERTGPGGAGERPADSEGRPPGSIGGDSARE